MGIARASFVLLACWLLAAHALRLARPAAAVLLAALPLLLAVRRIWAVRLLQCVLAVGAVEWLRTLVRLVAVRRDAGAPSLRMATILFVVAAVSATAAWLLGRRVSSTRETMPSKFGSGV